MPKRSGQLVNSICNNVLMEHYRSSNRVEALEDKTDQGLVETRPNALATVISDDTRKLVRHVLNGLNERDRRLLQAVFLEERDKDEVCTELGVDRDYLRVLLHHAKASFRVMYFKQVDAKKVFFDVDRHLAHDVHAGVVANLGVRIELGLVVLGGRFRRSGRRAVDSGPGRGRGRGRLPAAGGATPLRRSASLSGRDSTTMTQPTRPRTTTAVTT